MEDYEKKYEEEFDFDAIDAELADIIDRMKRHEDRSRSHAYIIGFKQGEDLILGIVGGEATLKVMFCALREREPFCDIKPLDAKMHKAMMDFMEKIKKMG